MKKMVNNIVDNAAGPTGILGILIGLAPNCPSEWLVFFSTLLVLFQLIHYMYRFLKWTYKRGGKR